MSYNLTNFQVDVLDLSQRTPVLVDFWAAWCGPCKMLGPILEKLAGESNGQWALVKIDTEAHPDLAAQFQIRGIPNCKLFHRGVVVAELSGALPEPQLRTWLAENLPTPKRESMARARELLHAGRSSVAAALLGPLIFTEPGDQELAVLTARALVFSNPPAALALVSNLPAASPWTDGAVLVKSLADAFESKSAANRLPDTPLRHRYHAALALIERESFDAGLTELIAVLEQKPSYADGQAKAVGIAIFRHLGLRHPVSEKFSRAFSMAVNV